jgi:hypothetical protein
MDRDKLKRELTGQFQVSLDQAMEAVEKAPDGQWIAASEWQIRDIFQRLMQQSFEKLLQARLDAADEAAFSPSRPAGAPASQQRPPRRGRADGQRRASPSATLSLGEGPRR